MLPFIIWNNIFPPYLPVEAIFICLYFVLTLEAQDVYQEYPMHVGENHSVNKFHIRQQKYKVQ